MDYQDPEFLRLRKQWYDRLAREGFQDIEHTDWETGESGNLLDGLTTGQLARREAKSRIGTYREPQQKRDHRADTQQPGSLIEEHARYYQLCEHWKLQLEHEGWPHWYRRVWDMHTAGLSYSEIGRRTKTPRSFISQWVRFQERRMLNLKSDGTPARGQIREDFMPVKAVKRGNKYRVVEAKTGRIVKRSGSAVDGGGHKSKAKAKAQARAINSNT